MSAPDVLFRLLVCLSVYLFVHSVCINCTRITVYNNYPLYGSGVLTTDLRSVTVFFSLKTVVFNG